MRGLLATIQFKTGGYFSPVVTLCFVANLTLFLACFLTQTLEGGGLVRWLWIERGPLLNGELWRLVTAGFTHVDFMHILFNLLMLGFFGHVVEQRLGSRGMAILILSTIVVSNGVHAACFPVTPAYGFSGASLAVLCGFATVAPRARVVFFVFFMPAWLLATIIVLIDVFGILSPGQSGVAHLIHLVGAFMGFAAIYWQAKLIGMKRKTFGWFATRKQAIKDHRESEDQAKLDQLLEKVSTEGLPSLTPAERKFLDQYSKKNQ